jgi:ribonuclease J
MPDGDVLPPGPDLIDGKSLNFGPFLVTPFLTDHSAFDAYSLLVEAESSRVFYSGDLRGHGRKARIFERLIQSPPTDIDAMLMEGTTLGREGAERGFPSEDDLEEEFVNACQEASGPVLVYASAQNIDRMVTIYRAAKRTGRKLVLDIYAAAVLEATEHPTIPQLGWDDVLLYIPFRQRIHIKRNELFDDLARLSGKAVKRIFQEDLPTIGPGSVFLFRPMHASDFERANALKGALLIYSQWEGYLRDGSLKRFQDWIAKTHLPMRSIHTSGHASVGDLKRLAQAVRPKHLIPIHTFHHGRYEATFGQATILNDGEWFTVGKASS